MGKSGMIHITHQSALEALNSERGSDAFDFLAVIRLLPYNTAQWAQREGVDHNLKTWEIMAMDYTLGANQ
jgi:hypothetical protein